MGWGERVVLKTLRDGNGQVDTHELKAALVAMAVTMQDYAAGDYAVSKKTKKKQKKNDTCSFTLNHACEATAAFTRLALLFRASHSPPPPPPLSDP